MAEFEMKCPHCGEALAVQEEWAGMKGECPFCKKSFTITLKPRKLSDPRKKSSDSGDLVYNNSEAANRIDVIAVKNTELSETLNFENVSVERAEEAKRRSEEIGIHVHLENRKSSAPQAAPRKKSSGNCNLVIDNYESENRVEVIAAIRELKNTGLSETLNLIDHLPSTLLENVSAERAEEAKSKMEEIGAHVHLEKCKSSVPQAEKKKRKPSSSSGKKDLHNESKKKASGDANCSSSQSEPSEKSSKDGDDVGVGTVIFILGIIALVVWLLWTFVTGMPRFAFWLIASLFWIIYIPCGGIKMKRLTAVLMVVTIIWGWWAHNEKEQSAAGVKTVASAPEEKSAVSSKNVAVSETAEKAPMETSQVKISVKVEPLAPGTGYSAKYKSYDFAVDYKLYADGECVATRTTNRISWYFSDISVKRGAKITAEIYEKNKHGAVVNVRNGPVKDVYASKEGGFMEIVCW